MSSVNKDAIYVGSVRNAIGVLDTANANRDGTGTIVDLFVADAANGSAVNSFTYASAGAIGAAPSENVIRLWIKLSSTYCLYREIPINSPATPTATDAGPGATVTLTLDLAAGESLSASIHTHAGTQDTYNVSAAGGNYSVA